jgi:acylphosphatase
MAHDQPRQTFDSMQTLRAVVYGRVQGVNFRHYTALQARELGLTGWVRNREDGAVETVATGAKPTLERFLAWLHRGSPSAQVTRVESRWSATIEDFEGFEIRF